MMKSLAFLASAAAVSLATSGAHAQTVSDADWSIDSADTNGVVTVYRGRRGDGQVDVVTVCNATQDPNPHGNVHSRTWIWVEVDGMQNQRVQVRPGLDPQNNNRLTRKCVSVQADFRVDVVRYETDPNIFIPLQGTYALN